MTEYLTSENLAETYDLSNVRALYKMGSVIGHRIDYNGVGAVRAQRHIPSKN